MNWNLGYMYIECIYIYIYEISHNLNIKKFFSLPCVQKKKKKFHSNKIVKVVYFSHRVNKYRKSVYVTYQGNPTCKKVIYKNTTTIYAYIELENK